MKRNRRDIIIKKCANLTIPMVLMLGLYVIIHGHLSPGGGFQGGVIIASIIPIYYIAYGRDKLISLFITDRLSKTEEFFSLTFVFIASLGIIYGVPFFTNVLDKGIVGGVFSSGTIFFMDFAVGYKVVAGISLLLLVMISILKGDDSDVN
ncbi:MnhB domain-containing protein [Clostridium sp.]|uniref:MnhB domain-containing protein n=1 Tax=Clostridium sp. TaxID=1506 RepID=UPI002FC7CC2B